MRGRPVLAAALGLLLSVCPTLAQQQLPPQPAVTLSLTAEQTRLIVQTLGAIGCQNVTQLILCEEARDLLREIQRQAREQAK